MVLESPPTAGSWYDDSSDVGGYPRLALDALRGYRSAELAMRKRIREDMKLNETDLTALQFVTRAKMRDEPVTPTDLMNTLGVTMASVTVMIDRLERAGLLVREMNPNDRRSRLVTSTDVADREVRATLEATHERMTGAVQGMSRDDVDTVVAFLTRMQQAVDGVLPAR